MGRLSIVVLFTPDLTRQQQWYEQSLGLTAAVSSPRWVQYATRDAALALRALPADGAPRIELGFDVRFSGVITTVGGLPACDVDGGLKKPGRLEDRVLAGVANDFVAAFAAARAGREA